jgi:hypothetical protein
MAAQIFVNRCECCLNSKSPRAFSMAAKFSSLGAFSSRLSHGTLHAEETPIRPVVTFHWRNTCASVGQCLGTLPPNEYTKQAVSMFADTGMRASGQLL